MEHLVIRQLVAKCSDSHIWTVRALSFVLWSLHELSLAKLFKGVHTCIKRNDMLRQLQFENFL